MKWIPLSERKPEWFICTTYEHFTDGRTLYYQDSIPEGATHWLEWTIPPVPEPQKPKDPMDKQCFTKCDLDKNECVCKQNEFSVRYPCHAKKSEDPDWKEFDATFKEWIDERHQMFGFYKVLFAMHKFLKAKYDN